MSLIQKTLFSIIKSPLLIFCTLLFIYFFALSVSSVSAVSNAVVFNEDVLIYISDLGINLTVISGSQVAGFTVNTGSVSFDMENGSNLEIRSYDRKDLSNSLGLSVSCGGSYSSLTLNSGITQTLTITPSASNCVVAGSGGSYSDKVLPTSSITTPVQNEKISSLNSYKISGFATDSNGFVKRVEISLDEGLTWKNADPFGYSSSIFNWQYIWSNPATGKYTIKVRAIDMYNNIQSPLSTVSVEVASSISLNTDNSSTTAPILSFDGLPYPSPQDRSQIESNLAFLLNQLSLLQAKLKLSLDVDNNTFPPFQFLRNLSLSSQGDDVKNLQIFLIKKNEGLAAQALGKNGATHYFGSLTKNALIEYQRKNNISPTSGYFGPITRDKINSYIINNKLNLFQIKQ